LDLPENSRRVLAEMGSHGLAKSTWSSYRTAGRLLLDCFKEEGRICSLPLTIEDTLVFVSWLKRVRKVKAATVESYLAGVRQLHIIKGLEPPPIKSAIVKWVLKGKKNMENTESKRKQQRVRLPMTKNLMKLLKLKLIRSELGREQKLLIWAVSTLAFNGAFRIHEILARNATSFDPDFTLLTEDLKVKTMGGKKLLEVKIKCPKEERKGAAVVVEVCQTAGTLCPVRAFEKWKEETTTERGLPLFRQKGGQPLTGRTLNVVLKELLQDTVDYKTGSISAHSFRIGLASTLGAAGAEDDQIKSAGRWSSAAFERYLKIPRVKRARVAKCISAL